ncbi:MAG TPA: hypothetical protein VJ045_12140 [Hyphomicrobiaceae bacterium]|nr:hypothetical protein [Hyphomicrobiaceae bacterium]
MTEGNGGPAGGPPETARSKVRGAWRLFSWLNRARRAPDWLNWLVSLFQTKAGAAVAIGSAGVVATTAAVVVYTTMEQPPPPVPAPVEVAAPVAPPAEPERQTQSSVIFAIEGKDKAGRRGTFDVVVARKEFLWVRKSSDELERDGKTITGADIESQVLDQDVRAALATAKEIIAVGTASQEGDAREETERAGRRAHKTAEIVQGGIDAAIPIWTLNLGQYREPCKDCEAGGTNWQRPFIVIAVKDLEPGGNVGEALADALSGQKKLPAPKSYSAFALTRFR